MSLAQRIGGTIQDLFNGAGLLVTASIGLPTVVMQSGVDAPITPGGKSAGWVSGDPAGLAASGTVLVQFDLGPDWDQYRTAAVVLAPIGPSTGFSAVQAFGGVAPGAPSANFRLRDAQATALGTINASVTTTSGAQQLNVRPLGRYLTISITNADVGNAVGATSHVVCAVYPG